MGGSIDVFATFFEVSLDLLCIRNKDFRLVRVNRAWEDVLGYSVAELEGAFMPDFIHPEDLAASRGHMNRMRTETEVWGFINRYRHRDGHYRSLEWRARRVGDLVFGLARDVTDRLAAEQEVREARAAAEAANQAKSDFLANMSHEIRTPLNGVIGIVDALSRTELSAVQREMVELIQSSGNTLERLVSDILDVAKIEAGRLDIESRDFDMRRELDAVFDLYRVQAREKKLSLSVGYALAASGLFRGDPGRIKQVLGNLLSNAVKFTESGGVSVRIGIADPASPGGAVILVAEIEDTGVGFPPEFAALLFQRFTQADSTITRRCGGSGLGLSICKSLVEAMGGEISAESKPAGGSLFRVRLPLLRSVIVSAPDFGSPVQPRPIWDGDAPPRPTRVLLAEDNSVNQRVIQLFLALQDTEVVTVDDGLRAVEALQSSAFDLVLMDMQMPVMDGLTATRAIRALEERAGRGRTPIVVLSANAMPQHHRDAILAGADLHLAKPVTGKTLAAAIELATSTRP